MQHVSCRARRSMWIRLHIPAAEEGNNFGVEVQEELLAMLNSGKITGLALLEIVAKYFTERATRITEVQSSVAPARLLYRCVAVLSAGALLHGRPWSTPGCPTGRNSFACWMTSSACRL
ncbi:MAG: hypothetical protein ACK4ZJ_19185, partial [Allorhizobium sp.]